MDIPTISLSPSNPNASSQLLYAAAKYGFVFVENDSIGIPPERIANLFSLSQEFFASPIGVKEEVSIASNKAGKNHGWLSRGIEMLDPSTQKRADVKEAFNIGEHIDGALQQPLPLPLQPHLQTIIDFQNACHDLCKTIFTHLATALEISPDWFVSRHDRTKGPSGTVLRLLYYPHVDDLEDETDVRAGAHSDFGSITLLFQLPGQPGLEIKTPKGEWAAVPVDPLASNTNDTSTTNGDATERALPILVNIGDLLEDWTGGLLKSTVHRVIFPAGAESSRDRYSMAYFCHPLDDAKLEAVPSKVVESRAVRTGRQSRREKDGEVLTARDHLMERLSATYSIKG